MIRSVGNWRAICQYEGHRPADSDQDCAANAHCCNTMTINEIAQPLKPRLLAVSRIVLRYERAWLSVSYVYFLLSHLGKIIT